MMVAKAIVETKVGAYPVKVWSDDEIEIEHYDSEDNMTTYVYIKKSELIEMLGLFRDETQVVPKETIDECYALCESCKGRQDGYEPLVQNYLESIMQEMA